MNRREFHRRLAGAALAGTAGAAKASPQGPIALRGQQGDDPLPVSIMLWTVFTKLPFEARLEKVAEAGYRHVELVGEFEKWSEEDYRRALGKARELGITFDATSGVRHSLADPAERDAMLDDLKDLVAIAERLNCPAVILLSGNEVPGMSRAQQHQSCIEGLKRGAQLIEGKNMRLLLESIDPEENPHCFLTRASEGFEIIRAVNHPQVQFLYDFYHEQVAEGNLIEKLVKNFNLVGLCHIADVPGRHEPGTGEIDYTNIYRKLAELNYAHLIAMEFLPRRDPGRTLREARLQAIRAFASASGTRRN